MLYYLILDDELIW